MSINKMKNETFAAQTYKAWQQKAEETLKGKALAALTTNTYEDISLQPLYLKKNMDNEKAPSQYPGQDDYRRGANALGYLSEDWRIAQKLDGDNTEDLQKKLLAAFAKGQTAISMRTDHININEFTKLIEDIYTKYPFSIETNEHQPQILAKLAALSASNKITGYIAADHLAAAAVSGEMIKNELYGEWAKTIQAAHSKMPNLRTILIDISVYHQGGANAVQELGLALAAGVHHLQQLLERGLSLETVLTKMVFKFSIGANFFMEIAKLRAARFLWSKVTEAYGAAGDLQKMVISAETSAFTKTIYDPYVNLLRAGNEAFAAVLGGIQYLHVSPYNELEGSTASFSDRIARNIQLILKEEAQLKNVCDPAGGSWYIEQLTNELTEKAWAFFLEIEDRGGIAESFNSGWIQAQIAEVMNKRIADISSRKQSIIGTNKYVKLDEEPLTAKIRHAGKAPLAIPQLRLSEPYEQLRKQAGKIGDKAKAGLICIGALKEHKARADFITGFLAPGGIAAVKSSAIDSADAALQFVENTNLHHYFICGTNQQYDEKAADIVRVIKAKWPNVHIYLAGLPAESKRDELQTSGIRQFIHASSNCYDTLASLLSEMEGHYE